MQSIQQYVHQQDAMNAINTTVCLTTGVVHGSVI